MNNLHNIGIEVRHTLSAKGKGELLEIIKILHEYKKNIYITKNVYKFIQKILKNTKILDSCICIDDVNIEKLDLFLFFGGDGTLLHLVHEYAPAIFSIPIFGINGGNLGFFSSVSAENMKSALSEIFSGKYSFDKRMVAKGEIMKNDATQNTNFYCLNEITIHHAGIARLRHLEVKLSDEYLTTYKSDGLIVSTPTGTTAYNLAAGGPIVAPQMEAFIITPLAPSGFSQRPIVLPAYKKLEISIDSTMRLSIDGQKYYEIKKNESVCITQHSHSLTFLRLLSENYYSHLRDKLGWG